MSERTAPPPRPRQVTLVGWLVVLGSLALVVFAFDRMSQVGSLAFQDAAAKTVDSGPFKGLGLSVDGLQTTTRVLCFVEGGAAIAAAILGGYVLFQRSKPSRLGLTVLAPFLFLAGLEVGTLPAAVVTVAIGSLWAEPARGWLDGRTPPPPPSLPVPGPPRPIGRDASGSGSLPWTPTSAPPVRPTPTFPTPPPPAGQQTGQQTGLSPVAPSWPPPQHPAYRVHPGFPAPNRAGARPGRVVAACVVTWSACGLMALLALSMLVVAHVRTQDQTDQLTSELHDLGLSLHAFTVLADVFAAIALPWSLAASVLAVLVFRRRRGAWLALVASAGVAGVLSLFCVIVQPAALVTLGACVAVQVLLLRPDVRYWFETAP